MVDVEMMMDGSVAAKQHITPSHAVVGPPQRPASPAAPHTPPASPPRNPMQGSFAAGRATLPLGNYQGTFGGVEYLPEQPADPMTGKGGRKWACYRFCWRVSEGPHAGAVITRDTPVSDGPKSGFRQFVQHLLGRTLADGEPYDLTSVVGQRYMLTFGPKVNAHGVPTTYLHVTNAIKM